VPMVCGRAWARAWARVGLVDELATSEEYIRSKFYDYDVIKVEPRRVQKRSLRTLLEQGWSARLNHAVATWFGCHVVYYALFIHVSECD
jgi:hypothetical protein